MFKKTLSNCTITHLLLASRLFKVQLWNAREFSTMNRKTFFQTVSLIILVGCAWWGPSKQVRRAAGKYQTVDHSMNKDDVYRLLGNPQDTLVDGRQQWRVVDGKHSAELRLRFNPDGSIAEIERLFPE